uniref:Uncharacterized protein n=1 Tax=Varroa destructor TaxID=109461 RepID=A0A7M7KW17_VARDE
MHSRIPLVRASSELSVEWRPKRATTTAEPPRKPRSKEDPREAKARDRARIRGARYKTTPRSARPGPARQPNPLPDQARHAPLLRANPYSEVTDPICRLPLPTLIYRLEALYLGDLLRIWVRTGATPPRGPLLDFQGPRGRSGHRRNCGALRVPNPISLLEVSRELERLYRKENSSRISRRRLQVILGYPDEHSYEGPNGMRFRCRVPE